MTARALAATCWLAPDRGGGNRCPRSEVGPVRGGRPHTRRGHPRAAPSPEPIPRERRQLREPSFVSGSTTVSLRGPGVGIGEERFRQISDPDSAARVALISDLGRTACDLSTRRLWRHQPAEAAHLPRLPHIRLSRLPEGLQRTVGHGLQRPALPAGRRAARRAPAAARHPQLPRHRCDAARTGLLRHPRDDPGLGVPLRAARHCAAPREASGPRLVPGRDRRAGGRALVLSRARPRPRGRPPGRQAQRAPRPGRRAVLPAAPGGRGRAHAAAQSRRTSIRRTGGRSAGSSGGRSGTDAARTGTTAPSTATGRCSSAPTPCGASEVSSPPRAFARRSMRAGTPSALASDAATLSRWPSSDGSSSHAGGH